MTQLRTKTYSLSTGAMVTVRESVGMDAFDKLAIWPQLEYDRKSKRMVKRAEYFADALLRSTIEGDPGFVWASPDDDAAALQAAFEGWQKLSNNDAVGWTNTLDAVNKALVDPNS